MKILLFVNFTKKWFMLIDSKDTIAIQASINICDTDFFKIQPLQTDHPESIRKTYFDYVEIKNEPALSN